MINIDPDDPELVLWPHQPGIEADLNARPLLDYLAQTLAAMPLENYATPAAAARSLGAEVVLSPLRSPRRGWTWFRRRGPLIEVADWLPREVQWLVVAHEICHVVLGPTRVRHDLLTERVCNWGAAQILAQLGP